MACSENENEYISETYNEEFDTKDEIINGLKRLYNKNDIKALRQYIIINKSKLRDCTAMILNEVVNVKCYKFMRRDGKRIISKISPSSKYYQSKDSKSEYPPNITEAPDGIASTAEFEGFSDITPTISKLRNDNIKEAGANANIQSKLAINNIQEAERNSKPLNEPINKESINLPIRETTPSIKPVSLVQDSKPTYKAEYSKLTDKTTKETTETMPQLEKLSYNTELTNLLNSIYKQANEQNENKRTQYEKLTKTLNDSIQAKDKAEQEQISRFNNCIATIEKIFSAGTFDRIIEHIDNMVNKFVNTQEAKNNEFDNNTTELLKTTKQQHEAINEINARDNMDNLEDNETIEDMNISINDLNDKIQEQEDTINKLKASLNTTIKQHADLINKLSLAVYNIDESIFSQIFNKQAQDGNSKDNQEIDNEKEPIN